MSMDRTFPEMMVAESNRFARPPLGDRIAVLKRLGQSWSDIRDTIVTADDSSLLEHLAAMAAECRLAAEDLGLCPREAAP